ncbi:hypothetical protein T484DRAFT_2478116 [Baffinella frigidus]|nr:hypothetical protein T484DRAFT_2478116 [Cryptophyta sp. CCMP2293]
MAKKPLRAPDAPGEPYGSVRTCDNFLSVDVSPREPRRYSCKHHGTSTAQKAKAKRMRETNQRIVYRLWGKACGDSKRFICAWKSLDGAVRVHTTMQGHVSITLCEIEQLLCAATDYPSREVYDSPMEFVRRITVVPRNPKQLYHSLTLLVTNTVKRKLFRAFKLDGLQGYTNALSEARRGSRNVFLPTLEQLTTMQSAMNTLLQAGCASLRGHQ